VDKAVRKCLAAVEVPGVGLQESAKTFVRVADRRDGFGRGHRAFERGPQGRGDLERIGKSPPCVLGGGPGDDLVDRVGELGSSVPHRREFVAKVMV
jgi:hypothetical protein